MSSEILTHLPEILAGLALIPDCYKKRAFRYIGKLLPSSLSKPRYIEMLKAHAEQRLSSINERRLLNVCQICDRTGGILGQEIPKIPAANDNPYEDDWLSAFENEACQKSSAEMQERFARILAGEIKRPGTFSIRAVKLLGQIDSETASIFRTFCAGCISFDDPVGSGFIYRSIFPSFHVGQTNRFLENYGISLVNLERLTDFMLLPANPGFNLNNLAGLTLVFESPFLDNTDTLPISSLNEKSLIPFLYAGNYYFLKSRQDQRDPDWDFGMPGIFLSSVGQELINIVELQQPIEQLTEDIKGFFSEKQLELVEVELTDDKHWKPKTS